MTKIIVSLILVLVSGFAQAGVYYDSKESCMSTGYAGKAVDYKPTAKHKAYGENRIAKHELRRLEADACVLIGAVPGKRWAFLKEGNNVLTKGTVVKMLAECQNDIYEIHYLKKDEPAPVAQAQQAECVTDGCGNVTKTQIITHVVNEVKVCEASNGQRFAPVNGECQFEVVKAKVSMQVESKAECLNCTPGVSIKPASTAPTAQSSAPCTTCGEKVTVTREEKRTDGRCFVQTNMGYKFEVRANASNSRLMASLVNPQNNNPVDGTRSLYVGNTQASKNSQGFDCDGMQQQLTDSWEAVRSAYGIPSACQIAKKD